LLRGEALAGLTVGLMVIPQGVAYAQLAGMPLITGIYASLLPALVAVLFSASARLSVGPVALTSLLIYAGLAPLAQPGSPSGWTWRCGWRCCRARCRRRWAWRASAGCSTWSTRPC
jgi:SulP family sulfate permease